MIKTSLIHVGTALLRVLPVGAARALALVAADLSWLTLGRRRRILEENLRRIAPHESAARRRRLARTTFRNLAICSVDFLRLPLLGRDQIIALVDRRGFEHLDRAVASGKGVLLLAPHLGNWELSAGLFGALGYPMHIYVEDVVSPTDRIYERYRTTSGLRVIAVSRGVDPGLEALRRGEIVLLLADRALSRRPAMFDFCGGRRPLPVGPAVMHQRTDATVLIGSIALDPRTCRYTYTIEPAPNLDALTDIERFTQGVADEMSRLVRQFPDQWFVFQPQWQD